MATGTVVLVRIVFAIAVIGILIGCGVMVAVTKQWSWLVGGFVACVMLEGIKKLIEKLMLDAA